MMQTLFEAIARHATERPGAIAFRDDRDVLSWGELAGRVGALSQRLAHAPKTVALAVPGGLDYVVADLALTLAGRRQVPLPFFFGPEQIAHIMQQTGAGAVIATDPAQWSGFPLEVILPWAEASRDGSLPEYKGGAERVIYTSGSSGRPKGVVIGDRQLSASLEALSPVVGAGPDDRHLSVLPMAQLLEQICGIFLPIMAGAECVMRFGATKALFGGPVEALLEAVQQVQPTTSLVTPGLLTRWVAALKAGHGLAPESLRFVAVGGAPSSPGLIREAEHVGIPVHEGYGLSECCAVVAMNRPTDNTPGTVGPILSGLDVRIVDGEITVAGPTVMNGYLGASPAPARWFTGDLGHIHDGRLVVQGRKDALLITPDGRNISPEWIEARVMADPRITCAALGLRQGDGALVLIVVTKHAVTDRDVAGALADLPAYARPAELILTGPDEPGLLFPAGTPNRAVAARIIDERDGKTVHYDTSTERLAS